MPLPYVSVWQSGGISFYGNSKNRYRIFVTAGTHGCWLLDWAVESTYGPAVMRAYLRADSHRTTAPAAVQRADRTPIRVRPQVGPEVADSQAVGAQAVPGLQRRQVWRWELLRRVRAVRVEAPAVPAVDRRPVGAVEGDGNCYANPAIRTAAVGAELIITWIIFTLTIVECPS